MTDKTLTIEVSFTLQTVGLRIAVIDSDGDTIAFADNEQDAVREACEMLQVSRYDSGLLIDIDGRIQ